MGTRRRNTKRAESRHVLLYARQDFEREFPNDEACFAFISERRFPKGVAHCKTCGKDRKHYRVTGRTALACDMCGHQIYPLAGTIFEKTTTPLTKWFEAMYLMGSTRSGISAKQLERTIAVTYKTAWRISRQIRLLFGEKLKLAGSSVEMDETYFDSERHGFGSGPTAVGNKQAIVERRGRGIAKHTENRFGATLLTDRPLQQ
jgi:transposase